MSRTLTPALQIDPLPPVPAVTLSLAPGMSLEFLPDVPASAADRRRAVQNSILYAIVGHRTDTSKPFLGGYVGMTRALHSARAGTSWTHWVIAQKAIEPTGMVLLHGQTAIDNDQLFVLEGRVIQRLSTDLGMLSLTNTQTSAESAASRLTDAALLTTLRLADEVAVHIHRIAIAGRNNFWPAPAPNAREASVRIVLRASNLERRALDTTEVVERLEADGYLSKGSTRWRSVRRDLSRRERDTRSPRIEMTTHRHRVLYHSKSLPVAEALLGYDRAHPRGNTPEVQL